MLIRKISIGMLIIVLGFVFSACDQLAKIKPTSVDRVEFKPKCKKRWRGKTVYVDFKTNYSYWSNRYTSNLASDIKERLIEDLIEDGCFKVQDRRTSTPYAYKVSVRIANPRVKARKGMISRMSATFKLKTYDRKDNLIASKKRSHKYESPVFSLHFNNSKEKLIENYAFNVSVKIRKAVYKSFK